MSNNVPEPRKGSNNYAIIGAAGTLLMIAGLATFLIATDRDPALLVTVLVAVVPMMVLLFGLDKIKSQTNGTLSALREENASLTQEVKALRTVATPDQIAQEPSLTATGVVHGELP